MPVTAQDSGRTALAGSNLSAWWDMPGGCQPCRFAVTRDEADKYAFKVPTLRSIALTAPYFHTGSAWDLGEAIDVMAKAQLGVTLTPDETGKIAAFLGALNGDQPQVVIPALPPSDGRTTQPEN